VNYNRLNKLSRKFIVAEGGKPSVNVHGYIQALGEILNNLKPKTRTERLRVGVAKEHIREVRRHVKRLENKVNSLQEQLRILEESKGA